MLHQQIGGRVKLDPAVSVGSRAADTPPEEVVSMLAYRSRAVAPPSQLDLDRILRAAQQRNRSEHVTGLLIYDQGCFFQWLEGPESGLVRIWESIQRDPRHHSIEVLREQSMPGRFFGSWDMRLARRTRGKIDTALAVVEAPHELLQRLEGRPAVLAPDAWDRLFSDVVIPSLRVAHAVPRGLRSRESALDDMVEPGAVWHAHSDAGAELGGILLAVDHGRTARYLNDLVDQGAGLTALYHEVFEPAARYLGGLWDDDLCSEFTMALGLGRLQLEARRLSSAVAHPVHGVHPVHAVLVATQPGETHALGATLSSELFWREGWDVSCEYPHSDQNLRDLVHERWFDVLDLSLSGALRRDHELSAMRVTIRAAQAASLNPALAVIVDGRSFVERPQAYLDVGADMGCMTSIDTVRAARLLVESFAVRHNPIHRLASAAPAGQSARAAAASLNLFQKRFTSTVF